MTFYEAIVCWFILAEIYFIYRTGLFRRQSKQKLGSNRANGLPSI